MCETVESVGNLRPKNRFLTFCLQFFFLLAFPACAYSSTQPDLPSAGSRGGVRRRAEEQPLQRVFSGVRTLFRLLIGKQRRCILSPVASLKSAF